MCENMAICVKIWLSLNIYVNVWKYGHLCENFTFIGYFCEICSMCENMAVSKVCLVSWSFVFNFWWSMCSFPEVLCSVSGEAKGIHAYRMLIWHPSKGRRAYKTCVSHLSKRRRVLWRCVSLLLNMQKKESLHIILHGNAPCANTHHARWHAYVKVHVPTDTCGLSARSTTWSTSCLKSLKHIDCRGFKSEWALPLVGEMGPNF
jgi:hypothetical protein